jgi:transcriptional regulator with XRE-family HTH domain
MLRKIMLPNWLMYVHCQLKGVYRLGSRMTKSIMTRGGNSPDNNIDYSQKILTRQEFGKRLYNFMMQKRMSQSDLSRASGMGRDSISQYVRGRSVPSPKNLTKLADALDVEIDVLFPNYDAQSNAAEQPTLEVKSIESDAENFWLRVNMKVPASKALEVMKILKG